MRWELEEVARETLERANVGTPVDPEDVAIDQELDLFDGGPGCGGYLVGRKIIIDNALRRERRAFAIAHELAHWLLRRRGIRDDETSVNYLAAALLLPRFEFESDLRQRGWDLIALCARHRFASFEAVARRICALRAARAVVFDRPLRGQQRPRWYAIPRGHRPTDLERDAASEAVATGAPVVITSEITAWPVLEHDWHRVITLANV